MRPICCNLSALYNFVPSYSTQTPTMACPLPVSNKIYQYGRICICIMQVSIFPVLLVVVTFNPRIKTTRHQLYTKAFFPFARVEGLHIRDRRPNAVRSRNWRAKCIIGTAAIYGILPHSSTTRARQFPVYINLPLFVGAGKCRVGSMKLEWLPRSKKGVAEKSK